MIEPPPSRWDLPDPRSAGADDLVGIGADLEPGTILAAYRRGLFPMDVRRGTLGWWSPQERGVLPLDGLHVSRRLHRSLRRFEIRIDTAFADVVGGCSEGSRPGRWITPEIARAYTRLFELGWAHSVEAWSRDDGVLAGGLYGLAIGGLFAAESKFHRVTDASKAAVVGLVEAMADGAEGRAARILDVQWRTDHLATLGALAISRADYLRRLRVALTLSEPPAFSGSRPVAPDRTAPG